MMEHNHKNNPGIPRARQSILKSAGEQFDAAGKSLYEALRISFIILKVIMLFLVVVFLASGFRTVGSDEQAIVLRFGKIRGIGENRLLGPGLHWIFPYPVEGIIKVPVGKKPNLPINLFWYYQNPEEIPGGLKKSTRIEPTLNPTVDGYCITRSEKQSLTGPDFTGSDYNIIHAKWQLIYKIDDPESFFKNVYTRDIRPGQSYVDIIPESINHLLIDLVADSVVAVMVNYTIDEALLSQDRIPQHVKKLLQERLDRIESGITAVSVQLTDITWPRQVDGAFLASIRASQESQKDVSQAKGYAENTLNEAAGPVAGELLAALNNETIGEQEKELLWARAAGACQEKIAQARAYRTKIVETARANADYLKKILPEYRKHPELVIQKLYQDAVEYVFNAADEKMVIQPTEGVKGKEIRLLLNRDPTLKPKSGQGQ